MKRVIAVRPFASAIKTVSTEYESWLANHISPETRRSYHLDCRQFFERFPVGHPSQITIQNVIAYRDELRGLGRQPSTIARKLSSVSSFFDWLKDLGIVQINPTSKVRFPKVVSDGKTHGFTPMEVRALLDAPDPNTEIGSFHRAVMAMLLYTGVRRSELCRLKVDDLFEKEGKTVVRIKGKGEKERLIVMHLIARNFLIEYLQRTGRDQAEMNEPLFTSPHWRQVAMLSPSGVYRIVRRYACIVGIDRRVSPHSCRVTAATVAQLNKAPLPKVLLHFGWSSPAMAIRYFRQRDVLQDSASNYIDY